MGRLGIRIVVESEIASWTTQPEKIRIYRTGLRYPGLHLIMEMMSGGFATC